MFVQQQSKTLTAAISSAPSSSRKFVDLLVAISAPTTVFLILVDTPVILPSLSAFSLAIATLIAAVAWWTVSSRHSAHLTLWDVSGAYLFLGFAAGILSDPEQVMELMAIPTNVSEAAR
jgi:hypothetical protein